MNSLIVIFVCVLGTINAAEWTYDLEGEWPGQCRVGTMQSPINIMTRDALVDTLGVHIRSPLAFRGYKNVQVKGENNGHTLKWNSFTSPAPVLSGGPLRGNYTFMQFHLHWLSEHALDGMKYPLEIHMVHIKTGLSVEEALKRPDGLAVIGVLGQVRTEREAEHALQEIMPDVPDLVISKEMQDEDITIDLSRLLSPDPQSFYTYHGSLTTPGCEEVVTWIVMDKPISISDTQYKLISKVDVGGLDNYRSLQPANRVVYKSAFSCASLTTPTFITLLVAVFNCFTSHASGLIRKSFCVLYSIKKKFYGGDVKECFKY